MEPLRIGLIGVGMMGREHVRNIKLFPDARIAAICDPVAEQRALTRQTLGPAADGVAEFETVEAMVADAKLDAVLVVSPNHTHRRVLEALFETPWAILCEKPLCTTVDDARWAAEKAARRRAVFWTGMEYRFMPPVQQFIADIHKGDVGRLQMLTIREHRFPFLTKVGDWNRFSRNTGGTMVEKCCHFFDLMRLIVKAHPSKIYCSGAMDVNHKTEKYNGETPDIIDNAFCIVDFENGARALLDLCMFAEGVEEQEAITAVGDKARLDVFIPSGNLVHSPRVPLGQPKQVSTTHVPVDPAALAAGTHHGSTYYQMQAFLEAVRGRGPVIVTAEDGLRAVAMGAAAEKSAREGRVVSLSEFGL